MSVTYGAFVRARNGFAAILLISSAANAETVTIAALGDSLTQGYGLPQQDGFVPQLEAWLQGQGADVTLINAGVSGDTTAGGLSRVGWTLTPEVDAMIVTLGGNDILRGLPPELARANIEGILQAAAESGVDVLLVGLMVTSNYGPDYQADFQAIYPDLAAQYGVAHYENFFDGMRHNGVDFARQNYMQPDGIHPNADGVARIVAAIGPAVLDLVTQVE